MWHTKRATAWSAESGKQVRARGLLCKGRGAGGEGGSDSERPHGPGKRQRVSAEGLGAPRL